jgi:ATP-dependent DNA helicase PIF1
MRRQFPLRVSFGLTINKSQGQTLDRVLLDLRKECFSHGQLYVGVGRAPSRDRLALLLTPEQLAKGTLKNVVWKHLLR